MLKVKLMRISFLDVEIYPRDIPKIRGYFATRYPEIVDFHNHLEKGFKYSFPVVQYRVIDNHPTLIAINTGIETLSKIVFNETELHIGDNNFIINDKSITVKNYDFGACPELVSYSFSSPWMALKEDNYKIYTLLDNYEKREFLNHLLRENLKTLSKGFNYFIPDIESIKVESNLKPIYVNFKNQKMLCFKGNFKVNFQIPDLLGIGKQSARGFGVLRKEIM
ncbi:MAG: hypothetical protein M0Q94_13140 [Candidatus Cloacimonetes bacterium]|nr:hypothetical protein [Candidatus Cloacimonadota bacterium]